MPQKQIKRKAPGPSKKEAANKHGKAQDQTRRGRVEKPPKKGKLREDYLENKEISRSINKKNEATASAVANSKGNSLKVLKSAPPALAPKDALLKRKEEAGIVAKGGAQAAPNPDGMMHDSEEEED